MAVPISGNQLKKLTCRLRDGTETPEDLQALADVLIHYRQVLERAHTDVARVCAETPAHVEPMVPRVETLRTTLVLVYRPETGELLAQEPFADGDTAMRRRFELERVAEYADTEVVVLSADSEQTLHETHGRYFYTAAELARRLRDTVAAV